VDSYTKQIFKHRHRKPPVQNNYFDQIQLEFYSFWMYHFPQRNFWEHCPNQTFSSWKKTWNLAEMNFLLHIHIILKNLWHHFIPQCLHLLTYYVILNEKGSFLQIESFPQMTYCKVFQNWGKKCHYMTNRICLSWKAVVFCCCCFVFLFFFFGSTEVELRASHLLADALLLELFCQPFLQCLFFI
jgi:hypothetical protein